MLKYKKLNKQVNELISLDKTQTAWHESTAKSPRILVTN